MLFQDRHCKWPQRCRYIIELDNEPKDGDRKNVFPRFASTYCSCCLMNMPSRVFLIAGLSTSSCSAHTHYSVMTSQIFKLLFSAQGKFYKYKTFTDHTLEEVIIFCISRCPVCFTDGRLWGKTLFKNTGGYFLLLQYHEWPLGKKWTQVALLYRGPHKEQHGTFIQVTKARVAVQNSLLHCWCIFRLIVCLYFPCFVRFRQQNCSVWFKKMSSLC